MKGIKTYVAALVGLVGLVGTAGAVPSPFFDTVVSFTPGQNSGVVDFHDPISSYTGPSGPGTFDPTAVTALDRVLLALGGVGGPDWITLGFSGPGWITLGFSDERRFFDGPGADVQIYGGNTRISWVQASRDGANFSYTGFLGVPYPNSEPLGNGTTYFTLIDLGTTGLGSARFLRLFTSPPDASADYPEGYHLDAVKALHLERLKPLPEPSTWVLLSTGLLGLLGYGWRQRRPTP